MITAAISLPLAAKAASRAARSLKGTVMVLAATPLGTPGLSGTPKVAAPLPGFDQQAVVMAHDNSL